MVGRGRRGRNPSLSGRGIYPSILLASEFGAFPSPLLVAYAREQTGQYAGAIYVITASRMRKGPSRAVPRRKPSEGLRNLGRCG
jgi:hypothetical protein